MQGEGLGLIKGENWLILHEVETSERHEIERVQLERLQETVSNVYSKVPFYKERFEERGIRPEDIKSLHDLKLLPFTRKADLRNHYPFGLLRFQQMNW